MTAPPPAPIPVPGPGDLEATPPPRVSSLPPAKEVNTEAEPEEAAPAYVGTGTPPPHASSLVPEEGGDAALARAARGATALANQVAGHAGVMVDESGSLVIKVSLGLRKEGRSERRSAYSDCLPILHWGAPHSARR
jgi:hypothetical protein